MSLSGVASCDSLVTTQAAQAAKLNYRSSNPLPASTSWLPPSGDRTLHKALSQDDQPELKKVCLLSKELTRTQQKVSTSSSLNSVTQYSSVITPIKLPSWSGAELPSEEHNSDNECRMSSPPHFKSDFAKRLSASSGLLYFPSDGDAVLSRVLEFPDDSVSVDLFPATEEAHSSLNSSQTNSLTQNNSAGVLIAGDSVKSASTYRLMEAITKHLTLSDEDTSLEVDAADALRSSQASMPRVVGHDSSFTGATSGAESKPFMNVLENLTPPRPEVSDIFLSSCLKVSEICSNLVETSNQKLNKVLSESGDFANASFNSSFDKMFDSVVEDDCDLNDDVEEVSQECNKLHNEKKARLVQFKLDEDEQSCDSEDVWKFEPNLGYLSEELTETAATETVEARDLLLERSNSKSKVCEDEMDVDHFLSGEKSDNKTKVKHCLEMQEKLRNISLRNNSETHFDESSKSSRKAQFDAIPEDDEASMTSSDVSSGSVQSASSPMQASTVNAPAVNIFKYPRPTTLPLFADMSKKEFDLHSPKRAKGHTTIRRHSDQNCCSPLGGRFANKTGIRSALKLSPFQPSNSKTDALSIQREPTDEDNLNADCLTTSVLSSVEELPVEDPHISTVSNNKRSLINNVGSRAKSKVPPNVDKARSVFQKLAPSNNDNAYLDYALSASNINQNSIVTKKPIPSIGNHPVKPDSEPHGIVIQTILKPVELSSYVLNADNKRFFNSSAPCTNAIPATAVECNVIPTEFSPLVSHPEQLAVSSPSTSSVARSCCSPSQHKLGITSICGSPIRGAQYWSPSALGDDPSIKLSRSLPGSPHKVTPVVL